MIAIMLIAVAIDFWSSLRGIAISHIPLSLIFIIVTLKKIFFKFQMGLSIRKMNCNYNINSTIWDMIFSK